MKTLKSKLFLVAFLCAITVANAQVKTGADAPKTKLNYEYAINDPYKTRIYTLSNGMKVYLSVYKNAPRVQTMIAVKAGSKNDPPDATGLAHYLEHMVFKGTDKYGTKDFAKESAQIQKIENLYETYRNTKDEAARKKIYHQIDSISGIAAKYAIANEYDKMLAGLGAEGTNAFTSYDQTVYVNDIPSNEIETWLKIEAERFRKPVLRLFHTELEAVYEEKNRNLDNDGTKFWEAMMSGLFKNHHYGTQTTIGTIDHLKNPSMKEIMKFYNKYYVPNNMAIIMSGDFDPDKTIAQIEKTFGGFAAKPVEPLVYEKEVPSNTKVVKEVVGPDAENVGIAWAFAGAGSKDADMITLISAILANGKAGLMDINLNQEQKVLGSGSFPYVLKDYGIHLLYGNPKSGQTLEEVEKLVIDQMELIKKGEFPDWLMQAVITDMKLQKTSELENNNSRASTMMSAFTNDVNWQQSINMIERLSKITKKEIVDFANANYKNNYVVVYKRTGEDKNVKKVEKPAITPVEVDRENQSPFVKSILSVKPAPLEPKFLDFDKDIVKADVKSGITLIYNKNTENLLFDLYYSFEMGSNHDKLMPIAIQYLPYVGTSKMSPAKIKEEFYKLGCSFDVFSDYNQTWVSLRGLNDNFETALKLFEEILADPKVDDAHLKNLVSDIVKSREDEKLNKDVILHNAMVTYARYGALNPFTYKFSAEELGKITTDEIATKLKSLNGFQHSILYYGPKEMEVVKSALVASHKVPDVLKPVPADFGYKEQDLGNTVFVADYDMKQAEIILLSLGEKYDPSLIPVVDLYNTYFGAGMSGVVFQDLRESKALAYSCYAFYSKPRKPTQHFYNMSYIGSQADKLNEALKGMKDLLNEMPKAEPSFNSSKELLIQDIRSQRITKANILFNYLEAKRYGLNYDIRKTIFDKVQTMKYEDIKTFHDTYVKGKPQTILVLGKKDGLDIKALEKYGPVKFLTLKDVFGY